MDIFPVEFWSCAVKASDFFNVERAAVAGPDGGGGQLYFQIPVALVDDTLKFLRTSYSRLPLSIEVTTDWTTQAREELTFHSKSGNRMRTGPQNRRRGQRLSSWSPEKGFPTLSQNVKSTSEAASKLLEISGLRIYLARLNEGSVIAGFKTGIEVTETDLQLPFSNLLFGFENQGGYWKKEGWSPDGYAQ